MRNGIRIKENGVGIMRNEKKNHARTDLRSEKVRRIIDSEPPFFIRWGVVAVIAVLLIVAFIAFEFLR